MNQNLPKPKTTSTNVLFCPQHKDFQFTVTEEERNQEIFTCDTMTSQNLDFFVLKNDSVCD